MKVKSPIGDSYNTKKVDTLNVSTIISKYKQEFNLDVSEYFKGLSTVEIYECQNSKLKFYYPFGLSGNSAFYDSLSKNSSKYYSSTKWEFIKALDYIKGNDKLLEIGCGSGYFLELVSSKTNDAIGLELNPRAVEIGKKKGLKVLPQLMQDFQKDNQSKFDVVCAFQLFEHVENIKELFKSSIDTLKKGGKLIIGVPNNSSQIFTLDKYHTLNLPPHHVLLWDESSLKSVTEIYGLKLIDLVPQPPTKIMKSSIYKLRLNSWLGENLLSSFIYTFTRWLVKLLPSSGLNQSILAIYEK